MNKSGLTPLISTMILLVFATGLGIIVMSWGSSYVQVETKDICSKTQLEMVYVETKPVACIKQGNVVFAMQNIGETDVHNYKMTVIGVNGINNIDVEQKIPVGEIIKTNTPYNPPLTGAIQKIIFTPRILTNSVKVICPKSSAAVDFVVEC